MSTIYRGGRVRPRRSSGNQLRNPVRATSTAIVMERMKKVGMDVSPANAAEMAQQSRTALLLRLHEGSENMPPFPNLHIQIAPVQ
jgi:hypothetical protein